MTNQITAAFKALRKHGYTARQNFSCCSSCAWSELGEQGKSDLAVFYNRQSGAALRDSGRSRGPRSRGPRSRGPRSRGPQYLYLNWSGDASLICAKLEAQGLKVIWPESSVKAIMVEIC